MDIKSPIIVDKSILPASTLPEVDFVETSFFRSSQGLPQPRLPSPALVRQRLAERGHPNGVVVFGELKLAVKCGLRVRVEEAQTLRILNILLPDLVPTPEVFGWRIFENSVYIYMSLVDGSTLHDSFDALETAEKEAITEQLCQIMQHVRGLRRDVAKPLIGTITGERLFDLYWRDDGGAGPFDSVKEFNDRMQEDALPRIPMSERDFEDPYRALLPDSAQVLFTHADLNAHNIMVGGPPGQRKIVALLDWEQSGWYPEYWEYCKMVGIEDQDHGWLTEGWMNKVLKEYEQECNAWGQYMLWRAP